MGSTATHVASSLVFSKVGSMLISALAFIIVARLLGPSSYGLYVVALAIAGVFGALSDFGVGQSFNKFIAEYHIRKEKRKIEELLSDGLTVLVIISAALTILAFLLSGLAAHYVGGGTQTVVAIEVASLLVFLTMVFSAMYHALAGFGMGKDIAIVTFSQVGVQGGVSVLLAFLGFGALAPLLGFEAGNTLGILLSLAVIYSKNHLSFRRPSVERIRKLLGFALPLAGSNLMVSFTYYVPPVVLGIFAATAVVGNFGVAMRLNNFIGVATESISMAILPMFSAVVSIRALRRKLSSTYNNVMYIIFILLAPALAYIAVLAKQISFILVGATYSLAPMYLGIMSAFLIFGIFGYYTSLLLIGAGKVKSVFAYNTIIALVQVISIIALIPTLKGIGAVLALFVINPLATAAIFVYGVRKLLKIRTNLIALLKVVVATAISMLFLVPVLLLLQNMYELTLLVSAAVIILVYPAVLAYMKLLSKKEVDTLRGVTADIPLISKAVILLTSYASFFIR